MNTKIGKAKKLGRAFGADTPVCVAEGGESIGERCECVVGSVNSAPDVHLRGDHQVYVMSIYHVLCHVLDGFSMSQRCRAALSMRYSVCKMTYSYFQG